MSSDVSLTIIAICQLVATVAVAALAGALVWAVFKFKRMISDKIDEAMAKVQPVVDQAQHIAEQAKATADNVSTKVDAIMAKAEDTADQIGCRVQAVSEKVEDAINPQVAAAAGVVGAVVKAVQLYQDVNSIRKRDGQTEQEERTVISEE